MSELVVARGVCHALFAYDVGHSIDLETAERRPRIAAFVEDYAIFEIEEFAGECPAPALWTTHAAIVARILRAETRPLSEQEVAAAVATRLSFGAVDATFVSADAALIYDDDPEDVRAVIEFANTQLLEMRYLDRQLDDALERAYGLVKVREVREVRKVGKVRKVPALTAVRAGDERAQTRGCAGVDHHRPDCCVDRGEPEVSHGTFLATEEGHPMVG